jgi:peptidoglycan-associated lipoprotein
MKNYSFRFEKPILAVTLAIAFLLTVSCGGKKNPLPPPPPAPPPAASNGGGAPASGRPVVAEFSIEPATIERGQSAVMRWTVTGSSNVAINNGVGTVPSSGTRRMTPDATITYTLTATGPEGDMTATATVTVTGPAPPPPPARNTNTNRGTLESRVQSDLRDVLYDYDSNNVSDAARTALMADADALKRIFADFPNATVNVEGHCDERGSAEYNLGLGDRRASSARDYLVQQGIPGDKLKTISYGKERPVCTESDESCWQRNRRAHFSVAQ